MLLLTIYIFRRIFNMSNNRNGKFLLASLSEQVFFIQSVFVQKKKIRSLQLEGKIASFSPLPSEKKHNKTTLIQLYIQDIPFLLYQLWITETDSFPASYVETPFRVHLYHPWEQDPFSIPAIAPKEGWACCHRKLHSYEKVFLPCSGWTASDHIGLHWMAWGLVPLRQ